MNKDQKLLEEAYQSIYESLKEPLYSGPPERKQEFLNWLSRLKHEVHEDGSVSVDGKVDLSKRQLETIPFIFKRVTEDFWCLHNNLTSLKGAPKTVGGVFRCSDNKLTSLEGAPEKVGEGFYSSENKLISLKGAPKEVGGTFWCLGNPLNSLEGAPEVIKGEFDSDQFSDEEYRKFVNKRKHVEGKLDKDLNVDLEDFS